MSHKFKLHQHVRMVIQSARDASVYNGELWEIVRLMPADERGEPSYRVRCNGMERAAPEQGLQAA